MKCGEDEAKERKNGDTAVSSGHDEAPLMAAVTKMANRPSPWLERGYKRVEDVEQSRAHLRARVIEEWRDNE